MGSCWKARGMMRGSFLLLLQATIIYCANIQHPVVSAPKCINGRPRCGEDPVSFGNKTRTLTSLSGIFDLPPSDDEAQPFKCPLTQPCKRRSLKTIHQPLLLFFLCIISYTFHSDFLAAAFLTGRAFWDLTIAAARCIATLVKSFLYLCLTIKSLTLCKLLRGPALNVTLSFDFPGL